MSGTRVVLHNQEITQQSRSTTRVALHDEAVASPATHVSPIAETDVELQDRAAQEPFASRVVQHAARVPNPTPIEGATRVAHGGVAERRPPGVPGDAFEAPSVSTGGGLRTRVFLHSKPVIPVPNEVVPTATELTPEEIEMLQAHRAARAQAANPPSDPAADPSASESPRPSHE